MPTHSPLYPLLHNPRHIPCNPYRSWDIMPTRMRILQPFSWIAHILQVQTLLVRGVLEPKDVDGGDLYPQVLALELLRVDAAPFPVCFGHAQGTAAAYEDGEAERGQGEGVVGLVGE